MDPLAPCVAERVLLAAGGLWDDAAEDLRTFSRIYEDLHRAHEADNPDAIDKILNSFAFVRDGATPSFTGTAFHTWFHKAFASGEVPDPEAARPPGSFALEVVKGRVELDPDFFRALDTYRDALQAVVDAAAPAQFTYQGFAVDNSQHMGDQLCRKLLEGVDYVVALFKKNGLEKLLTNEVRKIHLRPSLGGDTRGLYTSTAKSITLSGEIITDGGSGKGRFIDWVNEVFLHEFGHHVHMSYITGEARAVWDEGWSEVKEKKEVYEKAFAYVTYAERKHFYDTLMATQWEPAKAAKKLDALERVKFGVWLRTPMLGGPLITDKQFRLTKDGQNVAFFFRDTKGYMTQRYGYDGTEDAETVKTQVARVFKQMTSKIGLGDSSNHPIPSAIVAELSKADPAMQKSVEEALEKLEIVSPYGKTNEKEDFAETFVAFLGAPQKLTPTAKFRMQRTLSVSGLYGKPVMRLAERVAERYMATNDIIQRVAARYLDANVVPFKPKKPSGPTLLISGRKYVLSDYWPFFSDMVGEPQEGGARLIMNEPRFSYLWAFDTEKKTVGMWRVSDGDEKVVGSASSHTSEIIALDRKGQLNRVTHEEFRAIERFMRDKQDDTLKSMKKYLESVADDWDREAKKLAQELFDERFLPRILAKFREIENGVKPLGFKVDPHRLEHRSADDQARMFVAMQILKDFKLDALDAFVKTKGIDPDNPPGDIQALDWGLKDVLDEFYEKFFP